MKTFLKRYYRIVWGATILFLVLGVIMVFSCCSDKRYTQPPTEHGPDSGIIYKNTSDTNTKDAGSEEDTFEDPEFKCRVLAERAFEHGAVYITRGTCPKSKFPEAGRIYLMAIFKKDYDNVVALLAGALLQQRFGPGKHDLKHIHSYEMVGDVEEGAYICHIFHVVPELTLH